MSCQGMSRSDRWMCISSVVSLLNMLMLPIIFHNIGPICPDGCTAPSPSDDARIREMSEWFGWDLQQVPHGSIRRLSESYQMWEGHVKGHNLTKHDIIIISDLYGDILCMPECNTEMPWYALGLGGFFNIIMVQLVILILYPVVGYIIGFLEVCGTKLLQIIDFCVRYKPKYRVGRDKYEKYR